jgi:hypothetical protein
MPRHTRIVVLAVGVFLVWAALLPRLAESRLPGNHQGYAPEQPIAYSHRLHAGELRIPCLYCHGPAEQGRHAGIPSADTCMNCHRFVRAGAGAQREEDRQAEAEGRAPRALVSPELRLLYRALGLNDDLERDESITPTPIRWKRIHRLPDFAWFDHSVHVKAGVACQDCHGPVETMERVRQFATLRMGWCVNCHRDANARGVGGREVQASTDCAACHF